MNKTAGEEARRQLHKNVAGNIEPAATPHKAPTIRPPASHHKNYPSWTNQTCRTLLEKQGRAHKCTPMDPHIWPCKSRMTSSNSSYMRIRDVALKTCRRRWTIGRSGERGSGISVQAARHDDDDIELMNSHPSSPSKKSLLASAFGSLRLTHVDIWLTV